MSDQSYEYKEKSTSCDYARTYVHGTMILDDLLLISMLSCSICSRFSRENIHTRVTRTRLKTGHPSAFFVFVFVVSHHLRYMRNVHAKIYFLVARCWLHQFSFTIPPPYFHEVKLVFTNDPRTYRYRPICVCVNT